jgi:hypothetical protein
MVFVHLQGNPFTVYENENLDVKPFAKMSPPSHPQRAAPLALLLLLSVLPGARGAGEGRRKVPVALTKDYLAEYENHRRHLRFARTQPMCDEACRESAERIIFELADECEKRKGDGGYNSQFLIGFVHNEVSLTRWADESVSVESTIETNSQGGKANEGYELDGVECTLRWGGIGSTLVQGF